MMKERVNMRASIRLRRVGAGVAMWGGWAGFAGLGAYQISEYNPNKGMFAPQWLSFAILFLLAVAVAGSAAASRLKLAETIIDAFKAGLESARLDRIQDRADSTAERAQDRADSAAERALDREGG